MEHSPETEKALKKFIEETAKTLASHKASLEAMTKEIVETRDGFVLLESAVVKLLAKVFPGEAAEVLKKISPN